MAEMTPEDATPIPPDWRWVDTEHGRRLRDANNFDSDVIVPTGDGGFMVDPEQERIIAVAPEMLTVCKEVRDMCEVLRQLARATGTRYDAARLRDCVERLDRVIAKAEPFTPPA
jgi:hypothetical protein